MSVQRIVKFDGGLTARKAHKNAAIPIQQNKQIPRESGDSASRSFQDFFRSRNAPSRAGRYTDYKLNLGYTPTPAGLLTSRFALKRSNALVRGVAVLACGGPSQETAN